jgi:FKBP-type peptidyl-prolyl cis-trans isomerase FkpA
MKKFLMSVSMVAAMCVTMSSCLKNDSDNYVAPVAPADEAPALQAFIDSTGYNLITQSDSLQYYVYTGTKYELKNYLAPYLYYEVVDAGDQSTETVQMNDKDLGGSKGTQVTVYNKLTDSTLIFSATYTATLLDGTVVDKQFKDDPYMNVIPQMIYAWQLLFTKVNKGGHIRILTPSYFAYGNQKYGSIPVNSPMYFDVYIKGYLNNSYVTGSN